MLAHAWCAIVSKETKEECSQDLNERMHALIGYHEEDGNQCSMLAFQIALDETEKFQVIFNSNLIAKLVHPRPKRVTPRRT